MKKILILLFLNTIFIGCTVFNNGETGQVILSAAFPAGFSLKTIPAETAYIDVRISGTGLNAPFVFRLRDTQTAKFFDLPAGIKVVKAEAMDKDNKFLAGDTESVDIIPARLNRVTLTLVVNPTPVPTASSGPTPTPVTAISGEPSASPSEIPSEPTPISSLQPSPDVSVSPEPTATPTVLPTPTTQPTHSGSGGGANNDSGSENGIDVEFEIEPDGPSAN